MPDYRSLEAGYQKAGFGGALACGPNPGLVVVDFVNAYLDPHSPLYAGVESAVESARRILEGARRAALPIVFTEVRYQRASDGGLWLRKVPALEHLVGESSLADIVDELSPLGGELVIQKQYASAFFGTSLSSWLTAQRVDSVFIIGLSTSGCVRASAVDALQYGFVPLVVRDAVGDRDRGPHESSLFDIQAKYGEVIGEEEALTIMAALTKGESEVGNALGSSA